jgi:hypothetical protein
MDLGWDELTIQDPRDFEFDSLVLIQIEGFYSQ